MSFVWPHALTKQSPTSVGGHLDADAPYPAAVIKSFKTTPGNPSGGRMPFFEGPKSITGEQR